MKLISKLLGTPEQSTEPAEIAETDVRFARVTRLETKVRALEEEVETLNRSFKSIKLEWEESYDKLHHLMARVTKRAKVSKQESSPLDLEAAGDAETPEGPTPQRRPVLGSHGLLQQMRARHGLLPR